ncbi:hypothetical protein BH18PSE1_BH18PSE1_08790 [soil metagenome]
MSRFSFSRWWGIVIKEFIQLKRDRLTFGMIIGLVRSLAQCVAARRVHARGDRVGAEVLPTHARLAPVADGNVHYVMSSERVRS